MSRSIGADAAVRAGGVTSGGAAVRVAVTAQATRATPRSARSTPRARMMASGYINTPLGQRDRRRRTTYGKLRRAPPCDDRFDGAVAADGGRRHSGAAHLDPGAPA